MRSFAAGLLALFSVSAFACRINIDAINAQVAQKVEENLEVEAVKTQALVHSLDFWPEVITSSCPDSTIFYHAFMVEKEKKLCSVMTKFKLSYGREEIHPFVVLDFDCK